MPDSTDYLRLADDELVRQCEVDTFRASGPGGQKRNKTESAVRLRHKPTGMIAIANESRSQHENKARAVRRLRERIAFDVRRPADPADYAMPPELRALFAERPSRKNPAWPRGVQALLDLFVAVDCAVGETARHIGISTGALSKFLVGDDTLARVVNDLRRARNMRPLR